MNAVGLDRTVLELSLVMANDLLIIVKIVSGLQSVLCIRGRLVMVVGCGSLDYNLLCSLLI